MHVAGKVTGIVEIAMAIDANAASGDTGDAGAGADAHARHTIAGALARHTIATDALPTPPHPAFTAAKSPIAAGALARYAKAAGAFAKHAIAVLADTKHRIAAGAVATHPNDAGRRVADGQYRVCYWGG